MARENESESIWFAGDWVHQHRVVAVVARHRQLDQTQLGVVRPLAQKFRINSDIGMGARLCAELGKGIGRCDREHRAWALSSDV